MVGITHVTSFWGSRFLGLHALVVLTTTLPTLYKDHLLPMKTTHTAEF